MAYYSMNFVAVRSKFVRFQSQTPHTNLITVLGFFFISVAEQLKRLVVKLLLIVGRQRYLVIKRAR